MAPTVPPRIAAKVEKFGVGSFHFSWRPEEKTTVDAYVEALTAALNSIPTVAEVEFQIHEDGRDYGPEADPPDWSNGEGYYPPFEFFSVRFRLHIPRRLQDEILGQPYLQTGTETFDVHHTYGLHAPVTFVHPVDPVGDHDPSIAVRLVRDYLSREFVEPRHGISFQFLGPTPLPADFFLRDGAVGVSEEVPLTAEVEVTDAHDTIRVAFDANQMDGAAALRECYFQASEQLSDVYAVCAANTRALLAWEALSERVDELVNRGATTRWARLKRALSRGRELSRIHQTLAEFEAMSVEDTAFAQKCRKDNARYKRCITLDAVVDEAIDDRGEFPLPQIEKLVGHIEANHFHQLDLMVALVAAIVGGVVGSVITALLTRP